MMAGLLASVVRWEMLVEKSVIAARRSSDAEEPGMGKAGESQAMVSVVRVRRVEGM
jgi:hypothetical protein